ncbi:MAG: hypothetical protein H0U86_00945 [Chloroflexi bacterium]|nr:hypothetical protein [Chloroflexota bacterium]
MTDPLPGPRTGATNAEPAEQDDRGVARCGAPKSAAADSRADAVPPSPAEAAITGAATAAVKS